MNEYEKDHLEYAIKSLVHAAAGRTLAKTMGLQDDADDFRKQMDEHINTLGEYGLHVGSTILP